MILEKPIILEKLEKSVLKKYLFHINQQEKKYLLRNDIVNYFLEFCREQDIDHEEYEDLKLYQVLKNTQELIIDSGFYHFVFRYPIGKFWFFKTKRDKILFQAMSVDEYLRLRDFVTTHKRREEPIVKIDFLPFYDYAPSIKDPSHIGNGVQFLNKHLSSNLFQNPERWNHILFDFLKNHTIDDKHIFFNSKKINSLDQLEKRLNYMVRHIPEWIEKNRLEKIYLELKEYGFEPGWGNTPERIVETMKMLSDLLTSPDANTLESFISRIPVVDKIAIISPHGWFAQKGVLGKPDTGGQVIYILDQVKYLERNQIEIFKEAGLDLRPTIFIVTRLIPDHQGTTCNIRKEKVEGTENTWILRVPFYHKDGSIHENWVSRFHLWPYLERFSRDVKKELLKEFNGKPKLIIGNYSDGNLTASFLARDLDVTQCNIAHALEKSKYLFSDLYWKDMEDHYHFSAQFTADLIAMNSASLIVSSTYQEIVGTAETIGQYESHFFYSMPDFYHVRSGINLFHPKFNVVSPGVDESVYFPYHENEKRPGKLTAKLLNHLFFDRNYHGEIHDLNKIPILMISRLDKIKNITGFVEAYAKNDKLREYAYLMIVAGKLDPALSDDEEEKSEINRLYQLIDEYQLNGDIRWLDTFTREEIGEIYKIIADKKGLFVQPALFENFGLTIIEAMSCGLPTVATQFGGPAEIIQEGKSGFLINPTLPEEMSGKVEDFCRKMKENPEYWDEISRGGINRVQEAYTWNLYAHRLIKLAKLHFFWKFSVSKKAKEKMNLYCDLIYDDFIRKRLPERY